MAPLRSVLAAAAVAGVVGDEWTDWKMQFGKRYNGDEEDMRYTIFAENLEKINAHNNEDEAVTLEPNMFADLTQSEYASIYTGYVKPSSSIVPVLEEDVVDVSSNPPASVDWVTGSAVAVTKVKNQGSCGSCWAFSTTGSLEGANFNARGSLVSLSEQQLVDCIKDQATYNCAGCQGGDMYGAMTWVMQNAMCKESEYAYKGKDGSSCGASGCDGLAKGAVTGAVRVGGGSRPATDNEMMTAIAKGPVSIAIEADQLAFQFYRGGLMNAKHCGIRLDHGVLAVGYGHDARKGDYWKVKNSWGPTWGEKGYFRLKRYGAQEPNKGGGTCGILEQPVYPTIPSSVVV